MKDVTSNVQVGVATSGVYDLLGFESVLAIVPVTTGYSASAIKISVGDDSTSLTELAAGDESVVVRYDGSDGKTAKISYIGGKRYMKITGGTPTAVLLMNPNVAPVGVTKAPDDATPSTPTETLNLAAAKRGAADVA